MGRPISVQKERGKRKDTQIQKELQQLIHVHLLSCLVMRLSFDDTAQTSTCVASSSTLGDAGTDLLEMELYGEEDGEPRTYRNVLKK